MDDRGSRELPKRLRLEIGVPAIDPIVAEFGGADEVEEVQLSHGSTCDQLGRAAVARLDVEGEAGLEEFQRAVSSRVAADLKLRKFIVHAPASRRIAFDSCLPAFT